ncbi:MAG: hypothetical protein J0647_01460, partial [Campylobacteraceae bacterium]|nr:hypothetical protein [Campylobacteraceae bacterium]
NHIYNKQIENYKNSIVLDPYCSETCLIELVPEKRYLKVSSIQGNKKLLSHVECFFTSYLQANNFEISILIDIFSQYEALLFDKRIDLLYFHEEFQENIRNADNGIEIALSSVRGIYAPRYKMEQLSREIPEYMIECHPDGENCIYLNGVKHTALRCYVLPINASTTAQGSAKRIFLAECYEKFVMFGYTENHRFNYNKIDCRLKGIFD